MSSNVSSASAPSQAMNSVPSPEPSEGLSSTIAVVESVLPQFGLAELRGADDRQWFVTRSTDGPGFDQLVPGIEVELRLLAVWKGVVVSGYRRAGAGRAGASDC